MENRNLGRGEENDVPIPESLTPPRFNQGGKFGFGVTQRDESYDNDGGISAGDNMNKPQPSFLFKSVASEEMREKQTGMVRHSTPDLDYSSSQRDRLSQRYTRPNGSKRDSSSLDPPNRPRLEGRKPSVIIDERPLSEEGQVDNDSEEFEIRQQPCSTYCSRWITCCFCCCRAKLEGSSEERDEILHSVDGKDTRTLKKEFKDCFIQYKVPLNPDGRLRTIWDIPILISVMYTAVYVPLSLAWSTEYLPWFAFENIVTILFISDIYVNFHTSYRNEYGDWESSFRKCAKQYALGWFFLDLIASFPYDDVFYLLQQQNLPAQALKFLKLFRLLRITTLVRYITRIGLSVVSSLFVLLCTFILLCHWFACLFWFIASQEGFEDSWVASQGSIVDLANQSQAVQYSTAMYWAVVTGSTLGYGDVTAVSYVEQIYCTLFILIGALCYALVIASVQQLVTWKFSSGVEYNRWMDSIAKFSDANHLPPALKNKLAGYYRYVWERRKTFDSNTILADLPYDLRSDIADFIHSKLFQANPVFCVASMNFKHMLALKLGPGKVKLPDDVLFFEGESVYDIVLVRKGLLELVAGLDSVDELIVSSRKDGQYCGDLGIFETPQVHFVSVVVTDYSDIHQISEDVFLKILESYPKEKLLFQRVAEARKQAIESLLQKFRDHVQDWKGSVRGRDPFTRAGGTPIAIGNRAQTAQEAELWKYWSESVSPDADNLVCTNAMKLPMPSSIYGDVLGNAQYINEDRNPGEGRKQREERTQVTASQIAQHAATEVIESMPSPSPSVSIRRRRNLEQGLIPPQSTSSPVPTMEGLSIDQPGIELLLSTLTVEIEELERKISQVNSRKKRQILI